MLPLSVSVLLLAAWSLVGFALLAAVRADVASLRVCLTAPALGVTVVTLAAFAATELGASVEQVAVPIAIALAVLAVAAIAWRRPASPDWLGLLPVAGACAVALVALAGPMIDFGFHWRANANDDMANYVLGATRLLERGYTSDLQVGLLAGGYDYAEALKVFYAAGVRRGSETLLAWVSGVVGRPPLDLFMPTIVGLHLAGIAAAGALALQASSRRWAAGLAAAIAAVAPMATYGVVQQLIAQVFGLALAAALGALLMRRSLHGAGGATAADIVPIGVLVAGLALTYPELGAVIAVGYAAWLGLAALRREVRLRSLLRLIAGSALVAVVVLGPYALSVVTFLSDQAGAGTSGGDVAYSLFSFMLVPTAIPGAVGLQTLSPPPLGAPRLDLSIAVAALMLAALVASFAWGARRGGAAAAIGLAMTALAAFLALREADFGLFKLTMYVVPFAAAAIAAWVASGRRWHAVAGGAAVLVAAVVWLDTQATYVAASRQPIELPNASASHLLRPPQAEGGPERGPLLLATANIVLEKLQAVTLRGQAVEFVTRNPVAGFMAADVEGETERRVAAVERRDGWHDGRFPLGDRANRFRANADLDERLRDPSCTLVVPGPVQSIFNRTATAGAGDFAVGPCSEFRDTLVYVNSRLGQHYYLGNQKHISFYQLEADPYRPGETFSSFGRYALFRVLGSTPGARLEVDLTNGLQGDGDNRLPPVKVIGARETAVPVVGRGSARVHSPPVRPLTIDGGSYLMVDMGVDPKPPGTPRGGLLGLFGSGTPIDSRYLTTRMRNISLVPADEVHDESPPSSLTSVAQDLAQPSLEYSGIYEDGWVAERSYVVLAGARGGRVVVRGQTARVGDRVSGGGEVELMVDGRRVARRALGAGPFAIEAPIAAGRERRRIELRFADAVPLPTPDNRPVSARLDSVAVVAGRGR